MKKIYITLLLFSSFLLADTQTVAISYFDNTSGLEEYNPLSKGLADMLITDLSNVKSIQIVEREKLESLLKEIELGESKFMDESTAKKLGKGLGASYMLTGSYLIMGETIRIDARLVNVATGEVSMGEEITGGKNTFFELEKELVEKLIKALNISLSKFEERRVKKVQTESFDSFNAYSTALDSYDKGEYEESQTYLEKAVEIDADFEIAWDKLDILQEQLEQLLASRKIKLSTEIIQIMDGLENDDASSCRTFVIMLDNISSKLSFGLWSNRNYDGVLYNQEHKEVIIKTFNDFVKILKYYEIKKYPMDICSSIENPGNSTNLNMYIWDHLYTLENLLENSITFEINTNDSLLVNSMDENQKNIKNVIDEMIIYYGQKLLNSFPNRNVYLSDKTLEFIKRAIYRKENPKVYTAYKWLGKNKPREFDSHWTRVHAAAWGAESVYKIMSMVDMVEYQIELKKTNVKQLTPFELQQKKLRTEADAAMSRTADDWAKLSVEKEERKEKIEELRKNIEGNYYIGPEMASITIVAWIDFQDKYSARAAELFNDLLRKYPEDLKIVIKNYPLSSHRQARRAALYSMAAGRQGKYWKMFNKIFINYVKLISDEDLPYQYAKELGLDMDQLEKDMQDPTLVSSLNNDINEMKNAGFDKISVPKILINGTEPAGGRSLENYSKIIDAELKKY